MNAVNPFQIPSCFQISLQQRRRERFKKSVIMVVAGTTILLALLLIMGCNSEHARAASAMTAATGGVTGSTLVSQTEPAVVSPPAPVFASSRPSPIVTPAAAAIVSKVGAIDSANRLAAVYVVKPADTLGRIAKIHGTTVSALKLANDLDTDRITIGMKLKLPEA
jgi:LysM repeat protein